MAPNNFVFSRRAFTQGAASLGLASFASGQTAGAKALESGIAASLDIDASGQTVAFNRMLFGQFLEHFHRQVYGGVFEPGSRLSDEVGFRLDVVEALRELRVPIVRWPGGCFVSTYHWMDGVGKKRTPSFDKAWGVEDPNTFGTDEFVKWCRLIGAEPYICTNAGTGFEEEMSDWVEYCNLASQGRYARMRQENGHPDPFEVKYWSIGNENYFSTELGSKTSAEWGMLVRESAKLMRAVDSNIKLLAAATVDGEWTAPLLKTAGRWLNHISIHGYWDALWERGSRPADYLQCMLRSRKPEEQIERAIKIIDDNDFAGKIKIAFDEWNLRSWHHPGFPGGGADKLEDILERDENDRNETYTMADALFSASFLNGCLRHAHHVEMACMAPVVNVRGPLFVHSNGVVKRTTFHVLKMYSDLLEANVLPSTITSEWLQVGADKIPQVDALATRSADQKKVAIALVNRDPIREGRIQLAGIRVRRATLVTLDGDSPDAYNDVSRPTRVVPRSQQVAVERGVFQIPPHSVSVLSAEL